MHITTFISLLLGSLLLVLCRPQPLVPSPPDQAKSLEQRVADLEQHLNGNTPQISEAEARRVYARHLKEIQDLGLVERARHDFTTQIPNATIEQWSIGYVFNTNVVWCDIRYRVPGNPDLSQKEFGYKRTDGTNWSLIWEIGRQTK